MSYIINTSYKYLGGEEKKEWHTWTEEATGGLTSYSTRKIYGVELGAMSTLPGQRVTYLGAIVCGAETCYLGATSYGVEQRVQIWY